MSIAHYNFVIFGCNTDFYTAAYHDIMNLENVRYIGNAMQSQNRLLNLIYRFHTAPQVNRYIKLPLKHLYNGKYFVNDFNNNLPLCFFFFGYARGQILEWGYYDYIKSKFPEAKLVCYFQDLIGSNVNLSFDHFRRYFDLILSFDHGDAQTYKTEYYPLVYSSKCPFDLSAEYPKSDVFFVGKAKNRMPEIIAAFEKLTASGLRCDFHITEAEEDYRPYDGEIQYCDFMPYKEYLCRLKAANCILEIMQHGGRGYTLRAGEAIAYRKKLLSNNAQLYDAPFYRKDYVSVFENPDDIDIDFVNKQESNINYDFLEQISPVGLLQFVESKLNKTNGRGV